MLRGRSGNYLPCRCWCTSDRGQLSLFDFQASVWDRRGHSLLWCCRHTVRGPRTHCCRSARSSSYADPNSCHRTLWFWCGPGCRHSVPSFLSGPSWCRRSRGCHGVRGWGHWCLSWGSSFQCLRESQSRSLCPDPPGCRSLLWVYRERSRGRRCFWFADELKPGHRPSGSEWRCRRQSGLGWGRCPGPSGKPLISALFSFCVTQREARG